MIVWLSFQELFEEINTIIKEGEMKIDGENIKLEFFSWRRLQAINAMILYNSRWDMSKPEDYYWADEMKRTLQDVRTCCKKKKKKDNFDCIFFDCIVTLLNIRIENVRVDELHLLLRVTGRWFEKNMITNTVQWDTRDDKNKNSSDPKWLHLKALVKAINECGISFTFWQKLDGTGKKTSAYDSRSLVGEEKKKLLQRLPEKFDKVYSARKHGF
ncbi:Hypothetical predicted protein [Paramuricea clavata]|uniref:Uncharacterized protein n=1 Tax=Paramuricea clavata TaxID=317549 RepID=A0A6S7HX68_PARCT|nr:Hypothetical predicted protein [Paramuricea clavata]